MIPRMFDGIGAPLQELADLTYFGDAMRIIRETIDPDWKHPRGNLSDGLGEYRVEFIVEIASEEEEIVVVNFAENEPMTKWLALSRARDIFEKRPGEFEDEQYECEQSISNYLRWEVIVSFSEISSTEETYDVIAESREDAIIIATKDAWSERSSRCNMALRAPLAYRIDLDY